MACKASGRDAEASERKKMAVRWSFLVALCALAVQASASVQPAPFSSFHILAPSKPSLWSCRWPVANMEMSWSSKPPAGLPSFGLEAAAPAPRRTARSANLRISNGQDASPGQFPYQVGMYVDLSVFCGGALIHPKWILTAASCAKSEYGPRYTAFLGASNINLPAEKGRVAVTTTQAYVHGGYDKTTYKNDVALVLLPRAVKTSDRIKPIALPPRSYASKDFTGSQFQLSGWGYLGDSAASISPKLQYASLKGLDKDTCVNTYSFEIVSDDILCCSSSTKQSPCQGDTGGALVEQGTDGNFIHVAIASFMPSKGCSLGKPSGFTKTANFLDWIQSLTGITVTP
ncbi:brachyurin isoform X1 [Frankliniella occidentalis]|uniref:Brachyurin isoform X1 n=1 Tax=Frankliniella occidentalis TaxID=133901 RepID=A0A6J1TJ87_FRAOC|nr:brachyurin isoform X1 [Frankliniella occidentalis]